MNNNNNFEFEGNAQNAQAQDTQAQGNQTQNTQYTGNQTQGAQPEGYRYYQPNNIQKSRLIAGLLGIFLGGLGVHNFYLGFNSRAVIQLILTICSCGLGSLWGFIEGILILMGNVRVDASGVELRD
ncbi:MAG: TM2 domain-containing protein [Clostridia bacterium]|nr:TM2 domain-containing protein [Clostridia bacterium]